MVWPLFPAQVLAALQPVDKGTAVSQRRTLFQSTGYEEQGG